jgi:hypothetical protein
MENNKMKVTTKNNVLLIDTLAACNDDTRQAIDALNDDSWLGRWAYENSKSQITTQELAEEAVQILLNTKI